MNDSDFVELGQLPNGFSIRGPRRSKLPKLRRDMIPVQEIAIADHDLIRELSAKAERTLDEEGRLQAVLRQILRRGHLVSVAPVRNVPKVHPTVLLAGYLVAKKLGLVTTFPLAVNSEREPGPGPEPVAHMEPGQQLEVLRHFRRLFEVPIGRAWILPFLDYVEIACIDSLSASHADAALEEERRQEFQPSGLPFDPVKRGEWILDKTRAEISAWPVQLELPEWLNARFADSLIDHYGFDNGGGDHVRSRRSMTRLLANPPTARQGSPEETSL